MIIFDADFRSLMKRCLSPTASPPSSPIFSRTKKVEVQKKEVNKNEDCLDEDDQELTISKKEVEVNQREHDINTDSGVKFFSLASIYEKRRKNLSVGCPLLDRSLSGR